MGRPCRKKAGAERAINPGLLYETVVTLGAIGKRHCDPPRKYGAILRYTSRGTLSPVTRKWVKLEVAYDANGSLVTSVEAWRRFQERVSGVV
jgi:hypothetical protein